VRGRLRLALALLALAGCARVPPTIGDPAPTLRDVEAERAYAQVLERYSDRGEIYAIFDTRLFAGATLQTPAFREARVRRQALFQVLPPPKVDALLADERAQAEAANEFFLGVHVNEPRYDDFGRADSIWRVVLVTPSGEVSAQEIQRIGRADLPMRAFYPYVGSFWVGYRVRFPRAFTDGSPVLPEGTERVTLRLASALGKVELEVGAR
jgi:hypothetical protein